MFNVNAQDELELETLTAQAEEGDEETTEEAEETDEDDDEELEDDEDEEDEELEDDEDEEDEEEEDEDVVGVVSTPAGLEMFMRIAGSMGWGRRRWRQRRHGGNDHHAIRRRCPPAGPWPGRRTVAGWRAWGAR